MLVACNWVSSDITELPLRTSNGHKAFFANNVAKGKGTGFVKLCPAGSEYFCFDTFVRNVVVERLVIY